MDDSYLISAAYSIGMNGMHDINLRKDQIVVSAGASGNLGTLNQNLRVKLVQKIKALVAKD
jgi:hypothetical protein